MLIEEAITKAMDAGYGKVHWNALANRPTLDENIEKFFLDPLFWQSLGKAMERKWGLEAFQRDEEHYCMGSKWDWPASLRQHYWHRFIDDLAAGKSTEEFFSTL